MSVMMLILVALVIRRLIIGDVTPFARRHRGLHYRMLHLQSLWLHDGHWRVHEAGRSTMILDVFPEAAPKPAAPPAPPAPRETPLEALQRKFAAGHMSIEEYEQEVGKLYGLKN